VDGHKKLLLCQSPVFGGLVVRQCWGGCTQGFERAACAQERGHLRHAGQLLAGRPDQAHRVARARLAFRVRDAFREQTRPVDVDLRIQRLCPPEIHVGGVALRNMGVAQRCANHRAVLGFGQPVVVGRARTGWGAFDGQRVEPLGDLGVDVR